MKDKRKISKHACKQSMNQRGILKGNLKYLELNEMKFKIKLIVLERIEQC